MNTFVSRLVQFLNTRGPPSSLKDQSRKHAVAEWAWVYLQVVQALQQYPSGLTEAVIFNQVLSQFEALHGNRKRQRCDCSATKVLSTHDLSSAYRASSLGGQPLLAQVEVAGVTSVIPTAHSSQAISTEQAAPQASAITLQLEDGSTAEPVGMYLQARLHPLAQAPNSLFGERRTLRIAAHVRPCVFPTRGGAVSARLLPPSAMVAVLTDDELKALHTLETGAAHTAVQTLQQASAMHGC